MNTTCYFEFLKGLIGCWHDDRTHAVWLLDDHVSLHRYILLPELRKEIPDVGFDAFILPI